MKYPFLFASILISAPCLSAATVASNGTPASTVVPNYARVSDSGFSGGSYVAVPFTLTAPTTIVAASFEGMMGFNPDSVSGTFDFVIWSDSGSAVGPTILLTTVADEIFITDTGIDYAGDVMRYEANFQNTVTLEAGTYWFSVADSSSGMWYWSGNEDEEATLAIGWDRTSGTGYYVFEEYSPVFTLEDARFVPVPEPSAILLGAMGALGLFRRRRA